MSKHRKPIFQIFTQFCLSKTKKREKLAAVESLLRRKIPRREVEGFEGEDVSFSPKRKGAGSRKPRPRRTSAASSKPDRKKSRRPAKAEGSSKGKPQKAKVDHFKESSKPRDAAKPSASSSGLTEKPRRSKPRKGKPKWSTARKRAAKLERATKLKRPSKKKAAGRTTRRRPSGR